MTINAKTIMDGIASGIIPKEDAQRALDDEVEEWHCRSHLTGSTLAQHLGMSDAEYGLWVQDPKLLTRFIGHRQIFLSGYSRDEARAHIQDRIDNPAKWIAHDDEMEAKEREREARVHEPIIREWWRAAQVISKRTGQSMSEVMDLIRRSGAYPKLREFSQASRFLRECPEQVAAVVATAGDPDEEDERHATRFMKSFRTSPYLKEKA